MSQDRSLPATNGDERIVWSEDNPAAVWMMPLPSENASFNPDLKVSMPGSLDISPFKEPPPQYNPQPCVQGPTSSSHPSRRIYDRQPIKFLAMVVYLLLLYKIGTASFQFNSQALNWTLPQDLMRSHSRDFVPLGDCDYPEQNESWSTSRLGKLGPFSSFLTPSEMDLFIEAELELEPSWTPEVAYLEDNFQPLNEGATFTSTTTYRPNVPLPFHIPSGLFKLSRDMFDQGMKHWPFQSESRSRRVYDFQHYN